VREKLLTLRVPFQAEPVVLQIYEEGPEDGEIVVHCHGFGSGGRASVFFPGYRNIAPDFPGWGRSPKLVTRSSVNRYADLVPHVLDAYGIEQAYVVGISMGGAVTLATAIRHPQRVRAAVAAGPVFHGETLVPRPLQAGLGLVLVAAFPLFLCDELTGKYRTRLEIMRTFFSTVDPSELSALDPEFLRIGEEDIKAFSPRTAIEMMWDMFNLDLREGLRDIRVPTLLVDGDTIPYGGLDTIDEVARHIPQHLVQTRRIAGVGHLAPIIRPQEFSEMVQEFFRSVSGPASSS